MSFIGFRPTVHVAIAVAAMGAFLAGSADATISLSAVSTTFGAYTLTNGFGGHADIFSDNVKSLLLTGATPGQPSQLGIEASSITGANGGFSFEQNLYRQGPGSAQVDSVLVDTITNNGPDPVTLRFDSQITPGHIAALGNDSSNVVNFEFVVLQDDAFGNLNVLYRANGAVMPNGSPYIQTSDNVPFNGLHSYSEGTGRALDWSATNLDLTLQPIAAGASSYVRYETITYVTGGVACLSLSSCEGTQVAFGDPRNDGGVSNAPSQGLFALSRLEAPSATVPLIGELFDPHTIPLDFVTLDTPLPPTPPVLPAPNYAATPEPSTWALLLAGFGAVGAMRRRRIAMA